MPYRPSFGAVDPGNLPSTVPNTCSSPPGVLSIHWAFSRVSFFIPVLVRVDRGHPVYVGLRS